MNSHACTNSPNKATPCKPRTVEAGQDILRVPHRLPCARPCEDPLEVCDPLSVDARALLGGRGLERFVLCDTASELLHSLESIDEAREEPLWSKELTEERFSSDGAVVEAAESGRLGKMSRPGVAVEPREQGRLAQEPGVAVEARESQRPPMTSAWPSKSGLGGRGFFFGFNGELANGRSNSPSVSEVISGGGSSPEHRDGGRTAGQPGVRTKPPDPRDCGEAGHLVVSSRPAPLVVWPTTVCRRPRFGAISTDDVPDDAAVNPTEDVVVSTAPTDSVGAPLTAISMLFGPEDFFWRGRVGAVTRTLPLVGLSPNMFAIA